jgi:hypothetical protein
LTLAYHTHFKPSQSVVFSFGGKGKRRVGGLEEAGPGVTQGAIGDGKSFTRPENIGVVLLLVAAREDAIACWITPWTLDLHTHSNFK